MNIFLGFNFCRIEAKNRAPLSLLENNPTKKGINMLLAITECERLEKDKSSNFYHNTDKSSGAYTSKIETCVACI